MTLPEVLALALMLLVGVWLAVIDTRSHRLPNRFTLPLFIALTLLLAAAAWLSADVGRLAAALIGAFGMGGCYLLLALVPGGMGMGDVKLALSIGLLTGWLSLGAWLAALLLAFGFGTLLCLLIVLWRRGARVRIPFGPCMLLGWAGATALDALG